MESSLSRHELIELCRYRWSLPVLAALHEWRGARFAQLWRSLAAPQGAVRQALDALLTAGFVERAAGYGHPLRPEYLLTSQGRTIGPCAVRLQREVEALGSPECLRTRWGLPVVQALAEGPLRFARLSDACPGITDRALCQTLQGLQIAGYVERRVLPTRPPAVEYSLACAALVGLFRGQVRE